MSCGWKAQTVWKLQQTAAGRPPTRPIQLIGDERPPSARRSASTPTLLDHLSRESVDRLEERIQKQLEMYRMKREAQPVTRSADSLFPRSASDSLHPRQKPVHADKQKYASPSSLRLAKEVQDMSMSQRLEIQREQRQQIEAERLDKMRPKGTSWRLQGSFPSLALVQPAGETVHRPPTPQPQYNPRTDNTSPPKLRPTHRYFEVPGWFEHLASGRFSVELSLTTPFIAKAESDTWKPWRTPPSQRPSRPSTAGKSSSSPAGRRSSPERRSEEETMMLRLTAWPSMQSVFGLEEALAEARNRLDPTSMNGLKLLAAGMAKRVEQRNEFKRAGAARDARLSAFRNCRKIENKLRELSAAARAGREAGAKAAEATSNWKALGRGSPIAGMDGDDKGDESWQDPTAAKTNKSRLFKMDPHDDGYGLRRSDFLDLHKCLFRGDFFARNAIGKEMSRFPYCYAPPSYLKLISDDYWNAADARDQAQQELRGGGGDVDSEKVAQEPAWKRALESIENIAHADELMPKSKPSDSEKEPGSAGGADGDAQAESLKIQGATPALSVWDAGIRVWMMLVERGAVTNGHLAFDAFIDITFELADAHITHKYRRDLAQEAREKRQSTTVVQDKVKVALQEYVTFVNKMVESCIADEATIKSRESSRLTTPRKSQSPAWRGGGSAGSLPPANSRRNSLVGGNSLDPLANAASALSDLPGGTPPGGRPRRRSSLAGLDSLRNKALEEAAAMAPSASRFEAEEAAAPRPAPTRRRSLGNIALGGGGGGGGGGLKSLVQEEMRGQVRRASNAGRRRSLTGLEGLVGAATEQAGIANPLRRKSLTGIELTLKEKAEEVSPTWRRNSMAAIDALPPVFNSKLRHSWPPGVANGQSVMSMLSLLRAAVRISAHLIPPTDPDAPPKMMTLAESAASEYKVMCKLAGRKDGQGPLGYEEFDAAIRLMPGENYQNLTFRSEIAGRKLAVGDASSSKEVLKQATQDDEEQIFCLIRCLDHDCDGLISEEDFVHSAQNASPADLATIDERFHEAAAMMEKEDGTTSRWRVGGGARHRTAAEETELVAAHRDPGKVDADVNARARSPAI